MAQGQSVSRADTAQRTQAATSTLSEDINLSQRGLDEENAFAPRSDGDDDLGQQVILKETPKQRPFRFSSDAYLFWTDNARHEKKDGVEDTFFGWRVAAEWEPRITNRLYGDVGISQDWFRYDKLESLDFEALEVTAGFYYVMPELADSVLFLQYQYQWLTHGSEELLSSHSIRFGVQKVFLLDRRNSLHFSLAGDWDVDSSVDSIERDEYSAELAWRFKLMPNLVLGLGYRYTCLDYRNKDPFALDRDQQRTDNLHELAFNISYTPTSWLEIYAGCTYAFNRSTVSSQNYDAGNAGGGLGVRIKF